MLAAGGPHIYRARRVFDRIGPHRNAYAPLLVHLPPSGEINVAVCGVHAPTSDVHFRTACLRGDSLSGLPPAGLIYTGAFDTRVLQGRTICKQVVALITCSAT